MNRQELRELLDLSTWEAIDGMSSRGMLYCPYCNRAVHPPGLEMRGVVRCANCLADYLVGSSRLGGEVYYHTFQRKKPPSAKGGDA